MAAYSISSHSVTGAVGGGTSILRINMDPRFCALIAWATYGVTQGTPADLEVRAIIGSLGSEIPRLVRQGDITAVAAQVSTQTILTQWEPTPAILPGGPIVPFVQFTSVNVDGDVYNMDAYIYLFNIRVREKTSMGPLLWARGGATST